MGWMVRSRRTRTVFGVLLAGGCLFGPAKAQEPEDSAVPPSGFTREGDYVQSAAEARAMDAEAIARATGWEAAEVPHRLQLLDRFGRLTTDLRAAYPQTFAGGFAHPTTGELHVRFVGDVPSDARARGVAAGLPVTFEAGAANSLAQLEALSARVHADLVDSGFSEVLTGVDVTNGQVLATARRGDGPAAVPDSARQANVRLEVVDTPVVVLYGGAQQWHELVHERRR